MLVRLFKRMPLGHQALALLSLMLLSVVCALYCAVSSSLLETELGHARAVVDMADAFRSMTSKHDGFYVRRRVEDELTDVGKYLVVVAATTRLADGSSHEYRFHHKNPSLALSDFSLEVERSPAVAKFRVVSDNFMNKENSADAFATLALQTMRHDARQEYWSVEGDTVRYARALRAEPACLSCHGDPLAAPEAVRAQYEAPVGTTRGRGYGYVVGEVVGVTAVTLPRKSPLHMLTGMNVGFWLSFAALLALVVCCQILVLKGLVKPLRLQARYASRIATSDDLRSLRMPPMDRSHVRSRNEMHALGQSLRSLHDYLHAAMQRSRRSR